MIDDLHATGFPVSVRTGRGCKRANGTEVAEFRAMELSLGRPGNSLNEGIAGPHGRFDRTISDLVTHNGTGNLRRRDQPFSLRLLSLQILPAESRE